MAKSGQKEQYEKTPKKLTGNAKYLDAMFTLLKDREGIVLSDKKNNFNDTELRMIGEILSAKKEGKRLISTQLATLLGITRSAVSQIVKRLETRGVIVRVDDEVDRKIAYIEVSDEVLGQYQQEFKLCANFASKVVKTYGIEKFEALCTSFEEFLEVIEQEQKNFAQRSKI